MMSENQEYKDISEDIESNETTGGYDEFELIKEVIDYSDQKLEQIGFVNVPDIVDAMHDKDSSGHLLTAIEVRRSTHDVETMEQLSSTELLTTLKGECFVSSSGSFFTLAIRYDKQDYEIERLWNYMEEYGQENIRFDQYSKEFPVITFTVVPFSLGGSYSMVAFDPIFWTLQPARPSDEEPHEIRMMFDNDNVMFIQLPYLESGKMFEELKKEVAGERYTETMRAQDEEKRKKFEQERDQFIQQYVNANGSDRHSFQTQIRHGSFRPEK